MILGKTVTAPSFPPSYLLFSLIILNLVLYFFTFNGNLYKILIYIYGMMMLYDAKECETYLKYTIPINIVLVFADALELKLVFPLELGIVIFICIVYGEIILMAGKELLGSITFG